MANQEQIFNEDWQRKIGLSIADTGNTLELDEVIEFGKELNIEALREYMIAVGKNTREILKNLTYIKNFLEADSLRDFREKKKYMVLL